VGLLCQAKAVAVLTGAGVSKESGVPTFRDALNGLWAQYDPMQLATPAAFGRNPDLVWSWYMYRLGLVKRARPNPGHYAIADLEVLVPTVVVLTQNVDSLHALAGSTDVVELHGSIRRFRCSADCQGPSTIIDLEKLDHDEEYAPQCPTCGAYVRPDVVWYGEMLPSWAITRATSVAAACDVMVVVGTSGVVYPAASLPFVAKENGAAVIDVNPVPDEIAHIADVYLQGASGEVLPRVIETMRGYQNASE
jgi:NAD-dependent deacetylase